MLADLLPINHLYPLLILSSPLQIVTSLINNRPSEKDPSPTLLNFTSARYIRLQLQRIRTLNAELMTPGLNDPRELDPIVNRRVRRTAWFPANTSLASGS